jgi:hypothetical protein
MKFKLINPLIKGDMETTFTGGSSIEVANKAYQNLSQYFNNYIPKFYFTLEDQDNKFHHFYVKESRNGDNANYSIKSYNVKNKHEAELKKKVGEYTESSAQLSSEEQVGGKHHKDSSSSDSSDSDSDSDSKSWLDESSTDRLKYKVDPIVYWWYYPSVYRVRKFYVPTFVQSVTPILTIPLAYWS